MQIGNRINHSELRRSLNLVIIGITFGMAFFSVIGSPLGGAPFTGFIRALGAGDLMYGIIMALPILGGILQVFSSYYIESTGNRRSIFLITGFIHRLLWIPIAIIPLLFPQSQMSHAIVIIAVLITISISCNSIGSVAFLSWMGSLVPTEIKGRFFSRRTMISTITTVVVGFLVGSFLDIYPGLMGFTIVFIIISILGAMDIACFFWIKHPPMVVPKERTPFMRMFSEPFKNKNYMRLIVFITVWNFGVNFSGPFFNVYMIEYLKMGYKTISIFSQVVFSISTLAFIQSWGKLADRFGYKPVYKLCCSFVITLPFMWLFATPENYYVLLLMNIVSGACWPGIEMANLNMSIWLAPEKNRSIYIAVYSLITSIIGAALANVCGGAFMQVMRPVLDSLALPFFAGQNLSAYHLLFIMSGLIRIMAAYALLPRIYEAKEKSVKEMVSTTLQELKS